MVMCFFFFGCVLEMCVRCYGNCMACSGDVIVIFWDVMVIAQIWI